jgi:hypothetical protein
MIRTGEPAAVENGKENNETQNTVWPGNPLLPADPAPDPNPGAVAAEYPGFVACVGNGRTLKPIKPE